MMEPVVNLELGTEQIIRVRGIVDITNNALFAAALSRAIDKGSRVIIDLAQAEMLDSGAIAALYAAYDRAMEKGVAVSLTGANSKIQKLLQMSGLANIFGLTLVKLEYDQPPKEHPNINHKDWQITESVVLAEKELLGALRDLAINAALEAGLDLEAVADVRIAVTEALANAFEHGSPFPGKSKIKLKCMSCDCALAIEISDEGSNAHQPPNPSEEYKGLGTKLIMAAMDEVEFSQNQYGGKIRMLKWIKSD